MSVERYDADVVPIPGYRYYVPLRKSKTGCLVNYIDYAILEARHNDLKDALQAALGWIDAVPSDTRLPVMPGFDRDGVNRLLGEE